MFPPLKKKKNHSHTLTTTSVITWLLLSSKALTSNKSVPFCFPHLTWTIHSIPGSEVGVEIVQGPLFMTNPPINGSAQNWLQQFYSAMLRSCSDCFGCHKLGWKLSWGLLKMINCFLTYKSLNSVSICGHWLVLRPPSLPTPDVRSFVETSIWSSAYDMYKCERSSGLQKG